MNTRNIRFFLAFLLMGLLLTACRQTVFQSLSSENSLMEASTTTVENSSSINSNYVEDSTTNNESNNDQESIGLEETVTPTETVLLQESSVNRELRTLSGTTIAVYIDDRVFTIDMYDNPTANDLIYRLPLTLTVNDYPGWDEKIIRMQTPLSMQGAPEGDDPGIPEFGYYEPGQWLAIYYGYIGYWPGKVPLGQINASIEELSAIPNNATVKIDKVK